MCYLGNRGQGSHQELRDKSRQEEVGNPRVEQGIPQEREDSYQEEEDNHRDLVGNPKWIKT